MSNRLMLACVGFSAHPQRLKVLLVTVSLLAAVLTSGAALADGGATGPSHCGGGC